MDEATRRYREEVDAINAEIVRLKARQIELTRALVLERYGIESKDIVVLTMADGSKIKGQISGFYIHRDGMFEFTFHKITKAGDVSQNQTYVGPWRKIERVEE